MSEEISIPPAQIPVGDLLACELRYGGYVGRIFVNIKAIYKLKPGSFEGVYVCFDLNGQKSWNCPPFLVFQMIVTADFKLEQMGDGFPCKDEVTAKGFLEIIKFKNTVGPAIAIGNWACHFWFVEMENANISSQELILNPYLKPQKIGNKLAGYSIQLIERKLGQHTKLLNEEHVFTTNLELALKTLEEKSRELAKQKEPKFNQSSDQIAAINNSTKYLRDSQILVLSKAFPETAKIFQRTEKSDHAEVYEAFKRDVYLLTGKTDSNLTMTTDQIDTLINRVQKNKRKKGPHIDPIEYELVGGWYYKG